MEKFYLKRITLILTLILMTVVLSQAQVNELRPDNTRSEWSSGPTGEKATPVFLTRESFVIFLNENGEADLQPEQYNKETIQADCAIDRIEFDRTNFGCSDVGFSVINVTAFDCNGASSTTQADVEVRNEILPTFTTRESFVIFLDENGKATLSPEQYNRETISANCGINRIEFDRTEFDCGDVGFNVINVTAFDNGTYSFTTQADVEVRNEIIPRFIGQQSFVLLLDENGQASLSPDDINRDNISANCGISRIELSKTDFNCEDVGFQEVTVTAFDNGTYSFSTTANVEVRNEILPTFTTRESFVIFLDENGKATLSPEQYNRETISANCGINRIEFDRTEFDCGDVGFNVINVTAFDNGTYSFTTQADVEVRNEIVPRFVGQESFVLFLDENGQASLSPDDINRDNISANCGISRIELSKTDFTCEDVGFQEVTVTAFDNGTYSFSTTANVEVRNEILPRFLGQESFVLFLDENGQASLSPDDINRDNISANCGISRIELSKTDFNCEDVGFQEVTVTAFDNGTYSFSTTANVEVRNEIVPRFVGQESFVLFLDENGQASLSPDDINRDNISANCGISRIELSKTDFNCEDVGFQEVTVTAFDNGTYSFSTTANVEVRNEILPTFTTRESFVIFLDENGKATLSPEQYNRETISANCGINRIEFDRTEFDCGDVGFNVINVTAFDNGTYSFTTQADVEVRNEIVPRFVGQESFVLFLDENGQASLSPDDINRDNISANCGISRIELSKTDFTCEDVGFQEVTVTAFDNGTYSFSTTANVEVRNEILPTFTTRESFVIFLDENGKATLSPEQYNRETISANCGINRIEFDRTEFDCGDVGFNVINVTAFDNGTYSFTTQADVEVRNEIIPRFVGQESFVLFLDENGQASLSPDDINRDNISANCGISRIELSKTDFTCEDVGFQEVTVTAFDNGTYSFSTTASVEIRNEIIPRFIGQESFVLFLDENGQASLSPDDINRDNISANCGISRIELSKTDFTCEDVGFQEVTVTAFDNGTYSFSTTASVEVRNEIVPRFVGQESFVLFLDENGQASLSPDDINRDNISANCGISRIELSKTDFNCEDVGFQEVTVTAFDNGTYSFSTTASVEVRNEILPTFTTRESFVVFLDENGKATLSPEQYNRETISANCGIDRIEFDRTEFDCGDVGFNVINVTAFDNGTYSFSTQADVEVRNEIIPRFVGQESFVLYLDENGQASLSPDDINRDNISANCGISRIELSKTDFNCEDVGFQEVTVTAFDNGTYSFSTTANVEVRNEILPTFTTRESFVIFLDENGKATLSPEQYNRETISANCGINRIEFDRTEFDCGDVGFNVINVTAFDNGTYSFTTQADVEVRDRFGPTARAKDITVELGPDGRAIIDPFQLDNGSRDNCRLSFSLSRDTFTCEDLGVGPIAVVLTATDAAGNESEATGHVSVVDHLAPAISQKPIVIKITGKRPVKLTSEMVLTRVTDNCSIATLEFARRAFTRKQAGRHTVKVEAVDQSGNVTIGTIKVRVVDKTGKDKKVVLCYRGRTLRVDQSDMKDWLKRGAKKGACKPLAKATAPVAPASAQSGLESTDLKTNEPAMALAAYPNPAGDQATITFSSVISGRAVLSAYHSGSTRQLLLFDGQIEAQTNQKVVFNTTHVESGVYIIRLLTPEGAKTLKLLVKK